MWAIEDGAGSYWEATKRVRSICVSVSILDRMPKHSNTHPSNHPKGQDMDCEERDGKERCERKGGKGQGTERMGKEETGAGAGQQDPGPSRALARRVFSEMGPPPPPANATAAEIAELRDIYWFRRRADINVAAITTTDQRHLAALLLDSLSTRRRAASRSRSPRRRDSRDAAPPPPPPLPPQ